jgi:DNA-binding MarR family transcriptional regulator
MVKKSGQESDPRYVVADAVHSAALRLLRRARTADTQMDLDGPRASALSVLVFAGELPIGRLAALEQVSPPAITKTVSALEADGLVQRIRSDRDRRVVVVRVTPAGRALMERGRAARVHAVADLMDGLAERDRATLHRAARIVLALIEKG